jgi:hypothetical protein
LDADAVRSKVVAWAQSTAFCVSGIVSGTTEGHLQGWLYMALIFTVTNQEQLVRFPATTGRLPQEVLPRDVVTPATVEPYAGGGATYNSFTIAVGSHELFWVQAMKDMNQSQYIFHATLPPQPCDDGLPCANWTLVCSNGYCSAP